MQEVIDAMAVQFPDVTKKTMGDIVRNFMDTVMTLTDANGRVAIKNHIFTKKKYKARSGINPHTKEKLAIPEKTLVRYRNTKA